MCSVFNACTIFYNVLFCVVCAMCCLVSVWGLCFCVMLDVVFSVVFIMFSVVLLMFRDIFSSFPQPVKNFC